MTRLESGTVLIETALDLLITPKSFTVRPTDPVRRPAVKSSSGSCTSKRGRMSWMTSFGGVGCVQQALQSYVNTGILRLAALALAADSSFRTCCVPVYQRRSCSVNGPSAGRQGSGHQWPRGASCRPGLSIGFGRRVRRCSLAAGGPSCDLAVTLTVWIAGLSTVRLWHS